MTENQPDVQDNNEQIAEKLLPQSQVNDLVGTAKSKGYQKGYQQAMAELQNQQNQGMGGMAARSNPVDHGLSQDAVQQMIADELSKHQQVLNDNATRAQQEAEGRRILNELAMKVNDAKGRYDDFDDITSKVDFSKIPEVLHYSNLADNAGDVLYDLAKNPGKIGTLRALTPELAALEVKRLSDSIKANQQASNRQVPPEPMGQVKPSSVGMDSGVKTLRDYKRQFRG
jgi:hypothetical protein